MSIDNQHIQDLVRERTDRLEKYIREGKLGPGDKGISLELLENGRLLLLIACNTNDCVISLSETISTIDSRLSNVEKVHEEDKENKEKKKRWTDKYAFPYFVGISVLITIDLIRDLWFFVHK